MGGSTTESATDSESQIAIANWRQGDFVLGRRKFIYAAASDDHKSGRDGLKFLTESVDGLVVVSQSCDIVRAFAVRPYVEVAPLVSVEKQHADEIKKFARPRYAHVPALEEQSLVADLDRIMTVEKRLIATWQRQIGCKSDDDVRRFAFALTRKRTRFAFPDEFTNWIAKAVKKLKGKHGHSSSAGRAIAALEEIRVRAVPGWNFGPTSIQFLFIVPDQTSHDWNAMCHDWLSRLEHSDRFPSPTAIPVSLGELSARDYKHSDQLDLDHLTL